MKILMVGINSKFIHTNIAIRYIKGYCKGFDIAVKEFTINDLLENIISGIYMESPDVIGLSCYIWNIGIIYNLAGSLKKILPDTVIVLGGPEVSYGSAQILEGHGCIDYIVKGEGEVSSKALFSFLNGDVSDIGNVPGIAYRTNDGVKENECPPPICNLDEIPFPYAGEENSLKNKILYYESSRGCPFNCAYCLSSATCGVRFFSLERVKKDLMWFIERDVKLVKFVDRTFNCGPNYFEILKFLAANRRNTRFHFEISADILGGNELKFLNSVPAGLFQFEAGVQSTNHETLNAIDRNANLHRLEKNISVLRAPGNIPLHLDLIAGLPKEDFNSFKNSFDEVFAFKPQMLQLGFLKLLKGSKLRDNASDFGIVYNDFAPYEVLKTHDISYRELLDLKKVEWAADMYYNSGRFSALLNCLLDKFESPFELFQSLSSFKSPNQSINNVEQYRLIYDFCIQKANCDTGIARDCAAFDYLAQGRNPVMPFFLKGGTEVNRQFLWNFLEDDDNIKKYLLRYSGEDSKNIIKNLHAAVFSRSLIDYIKYEPVKTDNIIIIFDYGSKDENGKTRFFVLEDDK